MRATIYTKGETKAAAPPRPNWDIDEEKTWQKRQERVARENESRHRLAMESGSSVRNCLLVIVCILLLIQTGFSVAYEVRYREMKSRVEEMIEKGWDGLVNPLP